MQVAWNVVGTLAQKGSKTCRRMTAQRAQHQVAAEGMRDADLRFTAYGSNKLRNIKWFKYLGYILSHNNSDVPAMRQNLKQARSTWRWVSKILTRDEVPAPMAGMLYQAVVAAVLLYGCELWVLLPSGLTFLEGFHVEVARRMMGMCPQQRTVGPLIYPKSADMLASARLKPVATYIHWRRHTIAKTIKGRALLEECRGAERKFGSPPCQFW